MFYTETIDEETAIAIRALFRGRSWRIFPYGWWLETGGTHVIFDRAYRPICRIHPSRRIEIVEPTEWINFKRQTWFYRSWTHPSICGQTRDTLLDVVSRLQIEPELRRRRKLEKDGLLPRWAWLPGQRGKKKGARNG